MKNVLKIVCKILSVFILFVLLYQAPLTTELLFPDQEIKTKEEITVVNVEVPVRVFYKGEAVDNLTKSDFILYESNKQQAIHGFYKIKKKIKLETAAPPGEPPAETQTPPRYFVLVFRISAYNSDVKRGLDYMFKNILGKNDRLLIFANEKTLFMENLADKEQAYKSIDQTLHEQSILARNLMMNYMLKVRQLLNQAMIALRGKDLGQTLIPAEDANALLDFFTRYLLTWKEYKTRYLTPDIDKYYNFAQFLEKIKLEKWVITFYQVELFPGLKLSGEFRRKIDRSLQAWLMERSEDAAYARKAMSLLQEIDREFNAAEDFPAAEISKLFFKVGATFHSILMTVMKEMDNEEMEYKSLSTDIENSLREITAKTGGELLATNDLEAALDKVVEKDDICYMLTYAPDNPDRIGKISVAIANKESSNYKVIYDKNMRADYIREYYARKSAESPTVELKEIKLKDKKLSFVIDNFSMKKVGQENVGKLLVHILVKNRENEILYDKINQVEATKDAIALSIGVGWLNKGEYSIVIDVQDLFTGKNAGSLYQSAVE